MILVVYVLQPVRGTGARHPWKHPFHHLVPWNGCPTYDEYVAARSESTPNDGTPKDGTPVDALEATRRAAHEATARRAHSEAAELWSQAVALDRDGGGGGEGHRGGRDDDSGVRQSDLLLELARSTARAGNTLAAWRVCCTVADIARSRADGAAMADAAVVLRGVSDFALTRQIRSEERRVGKECPV